MDEVAFSLQREFGLDLKDKILILPTKTTFISSLMISKDPQACPTLLFHNNWYFTMACLLGCEPTIDLPISQEQLTYQDLLLRYNIEKTPMDKKSTLAYVLRSYMDYEMTNIKQVRTELMKKKKRAGKFAGLYEYMSV